MCETVVCKTAKQSRRTKTANERNKNCSVLRLLSSNERTTHTHKKHERQFKAPFAHTHSQTDRQKYRKSDCKCDDNKTTDLQVKEKEKENERVKRVCIVNRE